MKRYMCLILKILEYAEQRANGGFAPAPVYSEYTKRIVHYHIGLCK